MKQQNLFTNKKEEIKMIDTIHIYLGNEVKGIKAFRNKHRDKFIKKRNKTFKILGVFQVRVFPRSIKITGSMSEYIAGTNFYTPSFEEIINAFNEIGEDLKIDIMQGIVVRIDLAHNFIMRKPAVLYLLDIWSCPHTSTKLYDDTSVQLINSPITLSFYDKISDIEKKKKISFEYTWYEDANVFRYELQIKKRLAKKLKQEILLVKTLLDKKIYLSLINLWLEYFNKVKSVCITSNLTHNWISSRDLSPKQFMEKLAFLGFQNLTPKEKRVILTSTKLNKDHNSQYRIIEKLNLLSKIEKNKENGKVLWSELEKNVNLFYKKQRAKLL